eukprot:7075425-Alexandrium_andersonii.AAC.1
MPWRKATKLGRRKWMIRGEKNVHCLFSEYIVGIDVERRYQTLSKSEEHWLFCYNLRVGYSFGESEE